MPIANSVPDCRKKQVPAPRFDFRSGTMDLFAEQKQRGYKEISYIQYVQYKREVHCVKKSQEYECKKQKHPKNTITPTSRIVSESIIEYTLYRVSGFLSSRGSPPLPHPQASVAHPSGSKGGTHFFPGEGVGGPNSDEGTDTLVPYMYTINPLR
jgi:hypothetical protein